MAPPPENVKTSFKDLLAFHKTEIISFITLTTEETSFITMLVKHRQNQKRKENSMDWLPSFAVAFPPGFDVFFLHVLMLASHFTTTQIF